MIPSVFGEKSILGVPLYAVACVCAAVLCIALWFVYSKYGESVMKLFPKNAKMDENPTEPLVGTKEEQQRALEEDEAKVVAEDRMKRKLEDIRL